MQYYAIILWNEPFQKFITVVGFIVIMMKHIHQLNYVNVNYFRTHDQ